MVTASRGLRCWLRDTGGNRSIKSELFLYCNILLILLGHFQLFSLGMWYRKWKHEMKMLFLEKLKILFDKQDESIHKTWTFPFWVNALSFSSLGLTSQHVFRHPSHGLSSQMKNERMNPMVRHSVSSVSLSCHTRLSTAFVCWFSLQKTNTHQVFCSLAVFYRRLRLVPQKQLRFRCQPNSHIW